MSLVLYDIGSIGGVPKEWRNEDIEYVPFDPQENGYCIFDEEKEMDFYITRKKECSSLFKPDIEVMEKTNMKNRDFGRFDIVETRKVQTKRLDNYIDINKIPDFIKTDAQGADYEIIKSIGAYINAITGIKFEGHYDPIYKDIVLYPEIKEYLEFKGFELYTKIRYQDIFDDFVFLNKIFKGFDNYELIKKVYKRFVR